MTNLLSVRQRRDLESSLALVEEIERRGHSWVIDEDAETAQRLEQWRTDPLALAAAAHFTPDPWQLTALTSTSPTLLILCSRQSGKSTTIALLIVAELLKADTMTVIVAPSERQAKEMMRKVLRFWRQMGRPLAHVAATRTSLELENGARIEAFPASSDTVVGLSAVTLLIVDEAARVPDELVRSLSPMLAVSQGRMVGLTTPNGQRGWFHGLWTLDPAEDPEIERITVTWRDCPRITEAFVARERRLYGEAHVTQEYEVQFLDSERQAFRSADILAAFSDEVTFDAALFAS